MIRSSRLAALAVLTAVVSMPACSPTKPVFVTNLAVSISGGSNVLDIGQTARVTAVAQYSDSREIDISDLVAWTSSNPSVVSVAQGVVTAVGPGSANVIARHGEQTGQMSFHVR